MADQQIAVWLYQLLGMLAAIKAFPCFVLVV